MADATCAAGMLTSTSLSADTSLIERWAAQTISGISW